MRRWPRPEARPARGATASEPSSSAAAGGASRMLGGDGSSLLATLSHNTLRTCRIVHGGLDIIQHGSRETGTERSAYGPRLICALAVVSRGAEPGRVRSAACIDASICTCGHQQRRDTDQPRRFGWFGQQANGAGSGQGYADEVPSQLRRMRRLAKPSQATEQSAVRPQAVGPDTRRADQIRRKLMRSRHQGGSRGRGSGLRTESGPDSSSSVTNNSTSSSSSDFSPPRLSDHGS